jgi:hypothetical protein
MTASPGGRGSEMQGVVAVASIVSEPSKSGTILMPVQQAFWSTQRSIRRLVATGAEIGLRIRPRQRQPGADDGPSLIAIRPFIQAKRPLTSYPALATTLRA